MSSSLPWSLTPVQVHEALSQTEKKKKDKTKIILKGCYLITFLDLGPHKQKAPAARLYDKAGCLLPMSGIYKWPFPWLSGD